MGMHLLLHCNEHCKSDNKKFYVVRFTAQGKLVSAFRRYIYIYIYSFSTAETNETNEIGRLRGKVVFLNLDAYAYLAHC